MENKKEIGVLDIVLIILKHWKICFFTLIFILIFLILGFIILPPKKFEANKGSQYVKVYAYIYYNPQLLLFYDIVDLDSLLKQKANVYEVFDTNNSIFSKDFPSGIDYQFKYMADRVINLDEYKSSFTKIPTKTWQYGVSSNNLTNKVIFQFKGTDEDAAKEFIHSLICHINNKIYDTLIAFTEPGLNEVWNNFSRESNSTNQSYLLEKCIVLDSIINRTFQPTTFINKPIAYTETFRDSLKSHQRDYIHSSVIIGIFLFLLVILVIFLYEYIQFIRKDSKTTAKIKNALTK